jgi:hypothetical protein
VDIRVRFSKYKKVGSPRKIEGKLRDSLSAARQFAVTRAREWRKRNRFYLIYDVFTRKMSERKWAKVRTKMGKSENDIA